MVALPLPNLPPELSNLRHLALDLRWTWSHVADELWEKVDAELWSRTHNPWSLLQNTSAERLQRLAADEDFCRALNEFGALRENYLQNPGWFPLSHKEHALGGVAYFSMEFGIGAALPLYAGGLGVLAGDYLKTASDLNVPVIGIGLLFQEGYFRQIIDASGRQHELFPYNEPAVMPVEPVILPHQGWLKISLAFPGRTVRIRVWQATIGRVKLYLLDSNEPLNSPADRGITAKLYGGGSEIRLMQEIVLGVAGWRVIEAMHPEIEICHINEGHAAFAIIEKARALATADKLDFWDAFWASRAGNVFSTHTPVPAGFDRFPIDVLRKYLFCFDCAQGNTGVSPDDLIALGAESQDDGGELFNMAYLGQRGSAVTLGVSRLHGEFSRRIFQPLFPRWPACEVPVGHITNGVHIPTWDSIAADQLWTEACGQERWRSIPDNLHDLISRVSDERLWAMRGHGRQRLVTIARTHLATQLRERGHAPDTVAKAASILDPNVLTIGFARRFTEYKRPNLLLSDLSRLDALLTNEKTPIQIVVAGKAHPADTQGKDMIGAWIELARQSSHRRRVVFLEDYDIALAQELVQGVDVWINTPRRPWEACGTSGMKVLVNGGLNCSIMDGWWDEAYRPDLGWAIGDTRGGEAYHVDQQDADSLYRTLEQLIIPEFYDRDAEGMPRAWLGRIRASMSNLTPAFSSARMLRDYVEIAYLPLVNHARARRTEGCKLAKELRGWADSLRQHWTSLHIGEPSIGSEKDQWRFSVPVFLGEISPDTVRIELFTESSADGTAEAIRLHQEHAIPGAINGYVYAGLVSAARPAEDYTVRLVPYHEKAQLPAELPLILWQR